MNPYRLYWKRLHFLIYILCIYVYIFYIYINVVTSGIGKTSNFLDLLEIYFLKQTSSIWKQLWSNDNYNIWRQSTQVWFCPRNRNFTKGWHLREENQVVSTPKISQSFISIKNNCSNVIYLKYHQSLSNLFTCLYSLHTKIFPWDAHMPQWWAQVTYKHAWSNYKLK